MTLGNKMLYQLKFGNKPQIRKLKIAAIRWYAHDQHENGNQHDYDEH